MSAPTKAKQRTSLPAALSVRMPFAQRRARQKLITLGVPESILREIAVDQNLTFFAVVRAIEQEAVDRNLNQKYTVEVMCRHHRGSNRGRMQIDALLDRLRRTH